MKRMLQWMENDPDRALAEAITRSEYRALPPELKAFFEQPFNASADLQVMPVCNGSADGEPVRILQWSGRSFQLAVTGRRRSQSTKGNTPLCGIVLGERAVVGEFPFERLAAQDELMLANLPVGQRDLNRDFATGEILGERRLTALAGGKRYFFQGDASLDAFNRRLVEYDDAPGPHAGARIVFNLPAPAGDEGGFDWGQADEQVEELASAWTETPKTVFYIRADFSDLPGSAVTQANFASILNNEVADSISDMSYGKTTIIASVSPMTVRLPQPSNYYVPGKNTELHAHAKAAYEAIAGAGSLAGYDIVGVHFSNIGMQGNGLVYGGLAGGANQWLQGNTNPKTIVHEFGHNYGILHASFWATTNGTPVGTGTSDEYGDTSDMMGQGPYPHGHFHMQGKFALNWLTAGQILNLGSGGGSGTYRIHRFDHAGTSGALRGLRITKAASPAEYYWVGYRPGISDNEWLKNGAYLTWQRPGNNKSWLVDTTPNSPGGKHDSAIAIGRTYSDTSAGVHITPVAKGGAESDAWLDVSVQIGSFTSGRPPVVSLDVPAAVAPRTAVPLSATASDPDGDALAYSWDFGDGTTAANAATVEHEWLVGGTYTVRVVVSDMKGRTASSSATVVIPDPLVGWQAATPDFTPLAAAYLGGRFLAGTSGGLRFSIDGATWEGQALDTGFVPSHFGYDGTAFVAIASANTSCRIYRSSDGRHWERVFQFVENATFRGLAHGNGIFAALTSTGKIVRSSDHGKTWTISPLSGIFPTDIAFGDGVFAVVVDTVAPDENLLFTSTDAVTWTNRTSGIDPRSWSSLKEIEYLDGAFYAAGSGASGIHRSTDGCLTWQRVSVSGGEPSDIWAICAGPDFLLASASNGDSRLFLISKDGLLWNTTSAPPTYRLEPFFADGRFVSCHDSNLRFSGRSAQGNIAPVAAIGGPSTCNAREEVLFRSSFGDADGDPLALFWDFGDGTNIEEASSCYHRFLAGGTYAVKLYASDRRGGVTAVTHTVTVVDPLSTWIARTSGTPAHLNAIASGGGTLVAVGFPAGAYRVSNDGINWTGGALGGSATMTDVIHDGAQFVASGYDLDGSWKGAIYTSADGQSWTRRHFSGERLHGIAFGGGRYAAVGDAGALWYSTDAETWTAAYSTTTRNLLAVAHGQQAFVAVGGAARAVITSPDGLTWTNTSTNAGPTGGVISTVAYSGDRFLLSGTNPQLRYSLDAGNHFIENGTSRWEVTGFAYGNGLHFACGYDRANSNADANLLSIDGRTWTPLPTGAQDDRNDAIYHNGAFFTVGQNGSIWQSVAFNPPPGDGYASWKSSRLPEGAPQSAPDDDFDGDGMPNLGEYVTGTDPRDAGDRVAIGADVRDGFFIVTLPKVGGASGASTGIQFSADLVHWSANGVTIMEDNATRLVAKVPLGSGSGFVRPVFQLD